MPYTSRHIYGVPHSQVADGEDSCRELNARSDVDAVREADVWLRSSRVVARFSGEELPVAEIVLKDGREFARIVLNRIQEERAGMGLTDHNGGMPLS